MKSIFSVRSALMLGLLWGVSSCIIVAEPNNQGAAYSKTNYGEPYSEVYVSVSPPQAQVEYRKASPGNGYFWVDGHHTWNGNRWVWVSGHWERERSGYVWVTPYYENRGGRYVFVRGGWVTQAKYRGAKYKKSNSSGYGKSKGSGNSGYGKSKGSSNGYGKAKGSQKKCDDGYVWLEGKCQSKAKIKKNY